MGGKCCVPCGTVALAGTCPARGTAYRALGLGQLMARSFATKLMGDVRLPADQQWSRLGSSEAMCCTLERTAVRPAVGVDVNAGAGASESTSPINFQRRRGSPCLATLQCALVDSRAVCVSTSAPDPTRRCAANRRVGHSCQRRPIAGEQEKLPNVVLADMLDATRGAGAVSVTSVRKKKSGWGQMRDAPCAKLLDLTIRGDPEMQTQSAGIQYARPMESVSGASQPRWYL